MGKFSRLGSLLLVVLGAANRSNVDRLHSNYKFEGDHCGRQKILAFALESPQFSQQVAIDHPPNGHQNAFARRCMSKCENVAKTKKDLPCVGIFVSEHQCRLHFLPFKGGQRNPASNLTAPYGCYSRQEISPTPIEP
eukprot:1320752-Amorphochlora_amoeboformis.AAC.1